MKECIVFIESNTSGTGRLFALTARKLGLQPIIITTDPSRYPYLSQNGFAVIRQPFVNDLEELQKTINNLAREFRISGIYSSSEYFIETSAELAHRFGLPAPDPDAIRLCRHKGYQRETLQRAGVGVPKFFRVASVRQALGAAARIGPPVIVKPVMGSGSVGVRLCRDMEEVEHHTTSLLAVRVNERGMPVPEEVLIEEYISWPEFSAEIFNSSVIGITRKHVSSEPYFVETGHDFPAVLPPLLQHSAVAALHLCLEATRMTWGPAHIEFRCSENGCVIMEINPRLAGGFIPELVRLASGIDLIHATISLVTGKEVQLDRVRNSFASIRFICPQTSGRITRFAALHEAASIPDVSGLQLYKNVGDDFVIHHDFRDRIGHVVSCSSEKDAAILAAEAGSRLIAVEIEPAVRQLSF